MYISIDGLLNTLKFVHKMSVVIIKFNFEDSHPRCVNRIKKYQICVAIQSEHNSVILLTF